MAKLKGYCDQQNECIILNERCSSDPQSNIVNGRYMRTADGSIVCAVEGQSCSTNPLDASAAKGIYELSHYGMVCSTKG